MSCEQSPPAIVSAYKELVLGSFAVHWLRRGAVYLNATPFWAFIPPTSDRGITAQILRALVPYDGAMPAPEWLKSLIKRLWWDFFIQEETIHTVLQQVYIDRCTLASHQSARHLCCSKAVDSTGHVQYHSWTVK